MIITAIEKKKGRRYQIDIDGAYWYILDVELIADHHLKVGKAVTTQELEQIRHQADCRKAKERALYLLEYRDHSRKQLIDKLMDSVGDREIAEETADKMEEYGFLDDRRYGEKLARDLLGRKCLGKRRACYEMVQKGIDRLLAEELLDECHVDEQEQLSKLLQRKYARCLGDEKGRRRAVNALLRLGHPYEEIKRALEQYETVEEFDPWQ